MKITLDFNKKIIIVHDRANIKELIARLENLLKEDIDLWEIKSNVVSDGYTYVYPNRPLPLYNPYDKTAPEEPYYGITSKIKVFDESNAYFNSIDNYILENKDNE